MNYSAKDKFVAGCNWLMAGTAVVSALYVFVQLLSVPPQSPFVLRAPLPMTVAPAPSVPAPSPARAFPAAATQTVASPVVAPGTASAPTAAPNRPAGTPGRSVVDNPGGQPVYQQPAVPIPPLNPHTLPPGMKDF